MTTDDEEPEHNEDWVLENALEDVPFVVDLSGADHVEDLHKHKGGEDESQVAAWSKFFSHLAGVQVIS